MLRLNDKEFNMLAGTELYVTLLRNRMTIPNGCLESAQKFLKEVPNQGLWYSCSMHPNNFYIENARVCDALETAIETGTRTR